MNKDALLATFIGFIIGLCLTVLIVFGPGILDSVRNLTAFKFPTLSVPKINPAQKPSRDNSASENQNNSAITINSPLDESIADSEEIVISGKTASSKTIIVSTPVEEKVIESNSDGEFLGNIKLKPGKNDINMIFMDDGKYVMSSIVVYYAVEKL